MELNEFETDPKMVESGLIGIQGIKQLLLKKGYKEITPFYKYIEGRFSNKNIQKSSCESKDLRHVLTENILTIMRKNGVGGVLP
jgi:hypothetical protein